MNKFMVILKSKIRKNKGQYISFGFIVIIASMMLNLGLVIQRNFGDSFTKKYDKYNTADVFVSMMEQDYKDSYIDDIKKINSVDKVSKEDAILLNGSYVLNGSDFSMENIFYNFDMKREISQVELLEEKEDVTGRKAYVSYYLKYAGYSLGDTYTYTVNKKEYVFKIAGFVEDMEYGAQSLGLIGVYLPEESYSWLKEQTTSSEQAVTIRATLTDRSKSKDVNAKVSDLFSGNMTAKYTLSYFDYCKQVRTMTASVGGTIIITFAGIIVIVSMLISQFRINNDIEEDMRNMGVMKALGYRGTQIILSTISSYSIIGALASIIGTGLSYVVLPVLRKAFDAQTGFQWVQGFDLISACITVIAVTLLILAASYITARKIRKLQAIMALRGGIKTHNFKRNYIPMDTSKGNVSFLLSIKRLLANGKKNILLALVIFAVTFTGVFAMTMYYNIAVKPQAFKEALCEHLASVCFIVNDSSNENLYHDIEEDSRVDQVTYFDQEKISFDNEEMSAFVTEDFSKLSYSLCYKGRDPIHDNEITIGNALAESGNFSIGDKITISKGTKTQEYIISGFAQSVDEQGKCVGLTSEGYRKITPDYKEKEMIIYLKDESKTEAFINEYQKEYKEQISNSIDMVKSARGALKVFKNISTILCIIMILITVALIALILFILTKTVINHTRTDIGIAKALGYTTLQLRLQTAGSFMPLVMIGTALGLLISKLYMNSSIIVVFSAIGVMKLNFIIPIPMILMIGLSVILVTFLIAYGLCGRIKKISAYSLITE